MMVYEKNSCDTVIEEIHRTRRQIAEKFGGDIAAMIEDARKRQAASGRPIWQGSAAKKATRASGESDDSPAVGR